LRDDHNHDLARIFSSGEATRSMPDAVRQRAALRLSTAVATSNSLHLLFKALALFAGVGALLAAMAFFVIRATIQRRTIAAPTAPIKEPPAATLITPAVPSAVDAPVAQPSPDAVPMTSSHHATSQRAPRGAPAAISNPPPASSPPPPDEDTLAREVALLERARAQLDANPTATLELLDEHDVSFPMGKLRIERELLALDALERLDRAAEAVARAKRLLKTAEGTIYEARVRGHLVKKIDP
jgi:hypothetical protein